MNKKNRPMDVIQILTNIEQQAAHAEQRAREDEDGLIMLHYQRGRKEALTEAIELLRENINDMLLEIF